MKGLSLNTIISLAALAVAGLALHKADQADDPSRVVQARGLVIRDASGVPRVEIGAPVDGPMILGKREKRIAPASGILLNGPDGNERGGYLTVDYGDEALLTLDGAGNGREVFKVVANEKAGATLVVTHQNGAAAMLSTYRGQPELQFIERDGTVSFSQGVKK
ncbi:hypothetical protein GGR74_001286 [Xanthomonas arboricola]|jgi:hypothetical protein|uniref:hypothetical protein n=1 Tax=Xanthomonas TaxID=338 RepID=UPI000F8DC13A|nr:MULTISPECIES: hypothetical protein [Xanthomonas]MBB5767278.1 hypothetical protein [Xanthomonas euroxanthea]NIK06725.1 hypothetical protein [Xanthomonas euroxanthea]NIK39732.1 hypothetical protein [Xanthomonas euroxanthea]CAG2086521.1 hypothetical protein XCY_001176 [Xanthomonas euroxanthea]